MSRLLLFGFGPLPHEKLRQSGPSLRTWHFLSVLRAAGHPITLIGNRTHGAYPADLALLRTEQHDGWIYHSVTDALWHNPTALRRLIRPADYDAAIGITTLGAATAAPLIGSLPLWADLYGSIMAEAQLKAFVYSDDGYLSHFWTQERAALHRADKFSTVSKRQQWAVVGELGLVGRLNRWTTGYDFVTTLPIAVATTPIHAPHHVLRGKLVDRHAFVILYMGGYNTWTDTDTLFDAMEIVLAREPRAVLISTGGPIEGHDDLTYRRFQARVESSPYRDRFKLQGWIPSEAVPGYLLESDLAVNVDRESYEALLGSRTRVLDWLRAGLPCVLSSQTELSQQVVQMGAGLAYHPGAVDELAQRILWCIDQPDALKHMARQARVLVERYSFEAVSQPLVEWVERPTHAPDYRRGGPSLVPLRAPLRGQIVQALRQRRLNLSLALRVWPLLARLTQALGLTTLQRRLAEFGLRALRLERSPYRASVSTSHIPTTMAPRQHHECSVTLTNRSATVWPAPKRQQRGVFLAYHWKTPEGIMLEHGVGRVPMPHDIRQGQELTLTLDITAPSQPGSYLLEIDLLYDGVTWFSETGSRGPTVIVEVR